MVSAIVFLSGCKVGTSSLFVHPKDQGYDYEVTYDTLGGHINQMKTRVAYYAADSLLYEPSGNSGMLVAPKNGNKTLLGWYVAVHESIQNGIKSYQFKEEDRWDFATMRLNAQTAPDKLLTLYARWGDNPTICFVENNQDVPLLKWTLEIGSVLKRPTSTEPMKADATLVDYYVDETYSQKYTFGQEITEDMISYDDEGKAYMNIYCKFIEGNYIRIKTVQQLKAINEKTDGNYLLANDLDLKGIEWEPLHEFSGIFDGNHYTIHNMTIHAKNKVAGVAAKKAQTKGFGLFESLNGAKIVDLGMEDALIMLDSVSNVSMSTGIIAGYATSSELNQLILNNNTISANGKLKVDVTVSKLVPCDEQTKRINNQIYSEQIDLIESEKEVHFFDN